MDSIRLNFMERNLEMWFDWNVGIFVLLVIVVIVIVLLVLVSLGGGGLFWEGLFEWI